MYIFSLVFTALFLRLLPPVVPISSPGSLTRKVGQNALFMMNGTAMSEATWGVRDGNTNDLNPRLIRVFNPGGAFQDSKLNSTSYAGRVSFVGDLTRGQAWFKITNLNINDTNQYMAQILIGASNYENIPIQLTVLQPAPTTSATKTPHTSTANTTVPNLSSFPPPTTVLSEPTSSFPGNQSRNCECTCTTIIAACLTFIILLTVVITFLLFYIWKGKTKPENQAKSARRSLKLKEEELGTYKNEQSISESRSTELDHQPTAGKELYETIKKNRNERGTLHLANSGHGGATVTTSRKPPANNQSPFPSLPMHYQELRKETPQPIPLYEPLDQRNIGYKTESTGDTKTYEQPQQNKQGREYHSLKSYKNVESKV